MSLNHCVNEELIENIYVISVVLTVRRELFFKNTKVLCCLFILIAQTNSCIDTHALLMPNNQSKTGYGYKYRPG